MKNIYFIGGSPCSGKSTVAELLRDQYDLNYFKVDDFLDMFMNRAKDDSKKICTAVSTYTPEHTWMRDPSIQNKEELAIYNEIFEYIMEELAGTDDNRDIITEGVAFLPDLMKKAGIDKHHYICITPTKEFQISHYKERPWIHFVLEGCSDKQKAFNNWMDRDVLFAEEVRKQCNSNGYYSILTDGTSDSSEVLLKLKEVFGL